MRDASLANADIVRQVANTDASWINFFIMLLNLLLVSFKMLGAVVHREPASIDG